MGKNRMGLLDLRVQTAKLNAVLRGAQVTNIYDASNGRTYILKLSVPPKRVSSTEASASSNDVSSHSSIHSSWEKRLLLIESGVRLHMTQYDREKDVPSGFCLKLRKHIRTRRLDAVRQLGNGGDRIIDISFLGEGSVCAHLIIEAFSGGNVILTNGEYAILTLLRTYNLSFSDAESTRVAVRERYPVENARPLKPLEFESFSSAASRAYAAVSSEHDVAKKSGRVARRKLYARGVARKALAVELAIEPNLVEHALITAGFPPDVSLDVLFKAGDDALHSIYDALVKTEAHLVEEMGRGEMKGYIITSTADGPRGPKENYDEFSPFLFAQYRDRQYKEYDTFDEAADEFFTRLELERVEGAQAKRETAAYSKVDKLQNELDGQVSAFENARDKSLHLAQAIEGNIVEVDAAITVIRSAIAAAVPWGGLARMVQDEKRKGNPIAEIIHSLQLENNQITLLLEDTFGNDGTEESQGDGDEDEEDDDEEEVEGESEYDSNNSVDEFGKRSDVEGENRKPGRVFQSSPGTRNALLVPVDIDLSAHANARRHHEMRKNAAAKMEKAAEVKDRTIKAASKKAAKEAQRLEQKAVAASARAMRKAFWFEKFHWFVSQENYLVVAGRDTQQNDLLIKRYMGPADVYVHADVDKAGSVIVKNRRYPGTSTYAEIPQLTLDQAGTFALSRSSAWDSNIVTSAWWVRAIQVSTTTSTGLHLPVGSFAIRGKKNFLNPNQLVMGVAFMFKLDESSAANHRGERNLKNVPKPPEHFSSSPDIPLSYSESGDTRTQDTKNFVDADAGKRRAELNSDIATPEQTAPISIEMGQTVENRNGEKVLTISNPANVAEDERTPSGICHESERAIDVTSQLATKLRMPAKDQNELKIGKETAASSTHATRERNANKAPVSKPATKSKGSALPRGKKHKLKKMKKYNDQDDEERKIALAVLGSKPIKEESLDNNTKGESDDNTTDNEGQSREQNPKTVESRPGRGRNPKVEDLLLLDERGLVELESLESETVDALNLLTAIPTPDDVVEFALPVCAPYDAVSQYRYRAKTVPGSMKRGNAYRAALILFQKQAEKDLDNHKQELDAMRFCPEKEGIHSMLGNAKLVAPGLADAQKKLMKSKKTSTTSKKGGKQK